MPIGESQGITLPVVGSTVGPTWATALNTALTTLITSVETAVTPQGMNINSYLEFNGEEARELGATGFDNKTSAFSGSANIRKVYVRDGELYFNDGSANEVKLTSGGSLNASAIAGIGGDYGGSNPASVTFTDSTNTYAFLDNTAGALRAIIDCGQVLIRESLTAGYAVKLTNPTGMVADTTRTFAAALPGSTSLVTCSSAGVEAFTRDPSVDTITIAAAKAKHGELTSLVAASNYRTVTGTPSLASDGTLSFSGTSSVIIPIPMNVGDRLKSVSLRCNDGSATALTLAVYVAASGGATSLGSTASSGAGATQTVTVSSLTDTAETLDYYFALVTSLTTGDLLYSLQYVYDRVA